MSLAVTPAFKQGFHRHASEPHMTPRSDKWRHEIMFCKGDSAVEPLFTSVNARQHEGRRWCFESTTHSKTLIHAIAEESSILDVQHRDAKTATDPGLEICEWRLDPRSTFIGVRTRDQQFRKKEADTIARRVNEKGIRCPPIRAALNSPDRQLIDHAADAKWAAGSSSFSQSL